MKVRSTKAKSKRRGEKRRPLDAWSISRYVDWDECAARIAYRHVDKLPTSASKSAHRGTDMHITAHRYVNEGGRLPAIFKDFKDEFAELRAAVRSRSLEVLTEEQWAFTQDWTETEWFAKDPKMGRVTLDAAVLNRKEERATIIDYKSGRSHEWHALQLEVYAIAAFSRYDWVQEARGEIWYIDHGNVAEHDFSRDQLSELIEQWHDRLAPFFKDQRFAPRPGPYCRWCPYSKDKGGPCRY